jgi:putative sigma-54 modulation protein
MNLTISGHHLEVTPALREYVVNKLEGRDIHVEHANEDLYAAIDQLVDKLDRQVCRHKDRVQEHNHATAKRMEASP